MFVVLINLATCSEIKVGLAKTFPRKSDSGGSIYKNSLTFLHQILRQAQNWSPSGSSRLKNFPTDKSGQRIKNICNDSIFKKPQQSSKLLQFFSRPLIEEPH
jgi:hypothetical protein